MVKNHNNLIWFVDRLKNVVEKRSRYPNTKKLLEINQKIFQNISNCHLNYLKVFQVFDKAFFDGMFFKCLKEYNFELYFCCNAKRKNIFASTGKTTLNNNIFTVHIELPGTHEKKRIRRHVGFKSCKMFDDSCTIYLLEHEFVHVVELFLRRILNVNDGFSVNDTENNMFLVLVKILFQHDTDKNVL
jgi:hypothetical protein